ncbi:MAG: HEAT repeat domain-containing protein [Thioploca sp.]|nr:HEAT repeat domain-containing protein [Thioploca sp.]
MLKDFDSEVRNSAVLALGRIRTDQAITPLITLFNQEKDPDVRQSIALVLVDWGNVELLKMFIQQRVANPDKPHFRHAAYQAIDNMLITLEYAGNNADLAALRNFLPQVEDAATRDRIQWTIGIPTPERGNEITVLTTLNPSFSESNFS